MAGEGKSRAGLAGRSAGGETGVADFACVVGGGGEVMTRYTGGKRTDLVCM